MHGPIGKNKHSCCSNVFLMIYFVFVFKRKWLIEKFELYEEELKALEFFLDQDIRNNSAWNQRFFIYKHYIDLKKKTLKDEILYFSYFINFHQKIIIDILLKNLK